VNIANTLKLNTQSANMLVYLDNNKHLVSNTDGYTWDNLKDVFATQQHQTSDSTTTKFASNVTIDGNINPILHIKSSVANTDPCGTLKFTRTGGTGEIGFAFVHDGKSATQDKEKLYIKRMYNGQETILFQFEDDGMLIIPQIDARISCHQFLCQPPTGSSTIMAYRHKRKVETSNGATYEYASSNAGASWTNLGNWGRVSDSISFSFAKAIKAPGYQSTSDERIKTDIVDNAKPLLEIINKVRLKEYNYKYRENNGKTVGVIAQQVKADIDDVYGTSIVGEHDDITAGYETNGELDELLSITKDKLFIISIGAIQELTQKLEASEAKVDTLTTQNTIFQSKVDTLTADNQNLNNQIALLWGEINSLKGT